MDLDHRKIENALWEYNVGIKYTDLDGQIIPIRPGFTGAMHVLYKQASFARNSSIVTAEMPILLDVTIPYKSR